MRYRWARAEQIFARRRSTGAPGRDERPRGTQRSRTCRRYASHGIGVFLTSKTDGCRCRVCAPLEHSFRGGNNTPKWPFPMSMIPPTALRLSVFVSLFPFLPTAFLYFCPFLTLSLSLSLSLSQRQRSRRNTPLPFGARCRSRFYLSHSPSLALALALYPPRFVVDASSPKKKCVLLAYATRGLTLQSHCSLCAS